MYKVITIGGATRDFFFTNRRFSVDKGKESASLLLPYGEKLVSEKTFYTYGGGAVNVSISLKRLGLKTACVASIGNEGSGNTIFRRLEEEKVNTNFIHRTGKDHTGLSIFLVGPDGDHTAILERGANNYLKIEKWRPLKKTEWFYISSLTGDSANLLPDIFGFAKKHGIRIAFNPGSKQLSAGYLYLKKFCSETDILFLNFEEAETLLRSKSRRIHGSKKEVLSGMKDLGANMVVVTDGEKGSYVVFEGSVMEQKAHPTKAIDTTGAGDAFGSTFLYGVIQGFDLSYCLRIASVNSASVVTKIGAVDGLLTYNKVKSSPWL